MLMLFACLREGEGAADGVRVKRHLALLTLSCLLTLLELWLLLGLDVGNGEDQANATWPRQLLT